MVEEKQNAASDEMHLFNALDDFQHYDPPARSTRRSSILKTIADHNEPITRRISKRISFHNNIFCQQILADGTTQVITENLKARLPETTNSTISDGDCQSVVRIQQTVDSENIDPSTIVGDSKRKSIEQSEAECEQPVLPKRVKKDPKLIAKSYQKFMTKTYDVQDENDYHTIFNTSVNRNGFEVAPRDARPDVTKLFSVEATDSNMEVTKMLSAQRTQNLGPSSSENDENTRIFDESSAAMSIVDFSKSSQEFEDVTQGLASMEKDGSSTGNVGDISEMDTAMIIEDLEVTDDDAFQTHLRSALIPSRFIEQSTIEDISMSITEDLVKQNEDRSMNLSATLASISQSKDTQDPNPEPDSISLIQFDKTDEIPPMTSSDFQQTSASTEIPQESQPNSVDLISDLQEYGANDGLSPPLQNVENLDERTKCFDPKSDMADMLIENSVASVNQSIDKTNIYSDTDAGNGMSLECNLNDPSPPCSQEASAGSQPMEKETTEFGAKSATFQRRQTLSKIMSRFSFPRSLDNVLEMRKRQLNQNYYDSLQNIELSESIESISYSPQPASPAVQRSFHNSPSRISLSISNCSTPKKSPARLFGPKSQLVKNIAARNSATPKSSSFVVKEQPAEQVLELEDPSIVDALKKSQEDNPTASTSFNSSSSSISEMDVVEGINFDKSYNLPTTFDEEDEDDRDLHEDSMFQIEKRIQESSFALSPDSSFHSSFICMDDTLALRADDLDCKLNSFQFSDDESPLDSISPFQGVFVPLRKFEADKYGARFDLSSPSDPIVYFLYDLIEVHISFGVTARSFNGIPIKYIQKLLVKSAFTNDERFVPNQCSTPFLIRFNESHQWFFKSTSDLIITCFEDNKGQLLKRHPTSDLLPDLLREVAQWVMRGKDLLHEITTIAQFTNCYFYQKLDNLYEYAFELPGPRRNFFLIVPFDPKTYPFQAIQPRFGFYPEDRSLVSVNNFSKALTMCIKPGKDYIQRLVDNSKKFVRFCRKLEQRKKRAMTEKAA